MKIKNTYFHFLLMLTLGASSLFAQQQISGDVAKLNTELKALMAGTKNLEAVKYATEFEGSFAQLSEAQKAKVAKQLAGMQKKKLKAVPSLSNYIYAMSKAVKSGMAAGVKMDSLLIMNDQSLENMKTPKEMDNYFSALGDFFEYKMLNMTNTTFAKLGATSVSFRYIKEKSEEELPDTTEKAAELKEDQKKLFNEWDNSQTFEDNFTGTFDESTSTPVSAASFVDVPPLPILVGPIISFANSSITLGNRNDSVTINNTSGSYSISQNVILASGGKTDWSRLGKPSIVAEFAKYTINPKSSEIEAYDVTLNYPEVLENTVKGVFNYKCLKQKDSTKTYPRFMSYTGGVGVKNIGENIKYTGGFSLKGTNVLSTSLDESNAKIEIFKGDKKVITALSHMFELGNSDITAPLVSVILFLENDSITHPGVSFDYEKASRTLKLKNQSNAFGKTPYKDTYHKLEVLSEYVVWNLDKPNIDFSMITGRAESPAIFTSADYFNDKEFNNMKGIYKFHPLFIINTYMRETRTKNGEVSASALAEKYNINQQTFHNAMVSLNRKGFIDYNKGNIKMNTKGYHYIKSKEGVKDFDQINILSKEKSKANATLNLENMEMTVRGVEKFFLSEKLNVFILPENKEVRIQKNRDFKFDGKLLTSDMLSFYGKDMRFDYDSFYVDMKTIDSLKLRVRTKEKDASGKFIIKDLKSQVESASGDLFINKTMNKSAKKSYPEYPIFKSKKGSFVYYDKPYILNGIYAKQVYFEVPPFTIDSLTVFTEPVFDGTFKSNGIFPDIKERLRPNQEDLSLGFDHKIPKDGYKVYNGKGKFYKSFSLSNKGIRGDGDLEYLTGKYKSNDFVFYPDSLHSVGSSAEIKEGEINKVQFPDLISGEYDLYWLPKNDSMMVTNVSQPFKMYNKTVDWNGKLFVTPAGLKGEGTVDTRGSETSSLKYKFGKDEFDAREAFFKINSNDASKPAVEAKNVKLEFNLKKGHAFFTPEIAGSAANNFPYLQYESSMEGGDWDLTKKVITFKKKDDADIKGSYFVSSHPLQDSLIFNATDAIYEMNKQTLTVNGVPFIYIGDSKVIPEKGKVVINENADMQELTSAKIVIDSTKKKYHLYDGKVKILSRLRMRGEAKYDYYNIDSAKFVLKFSDFYYRDVNLPRPTAEEIAAQDELIEKEVEETEDVVLDTKAAKKVAKKKKIKERKNKKKINESFHLEAIAQIAETDTFRLAPKIFYQGSAIIRADKPNLMFDGQVKMDLQAYRGLQQWLPYKNDGETDNIAIDVRNAKADDDSPLFTGLFLDNSSLKLYSTFLSLKHYPEDQMVFEAKDNFAFDNKKSIFRIGDLPKIDGKKLQGNVFSYFDKKGIVSYTGKLNLLPENKDFMIKTSTLGTGLVDSSFYNFNTFMALTMNIPAKALEIMGTNIRIMAVAVGAPPAYINKDTMGFKIADIYGEKSGQSFVKTMTIGNRPLFEYNKKMGTAMNLNEVDFNWSNKFSSFYSTGKIAISNIYKTDVNFKVNGFCEVKKSPNGDIFTLYLEPTPTSWYYFNFEANKLSIVSSDENFNTAIRSKSKGEQSGGKYSFVLAEIEEKSLFLKEYNQNYFGVDFKEPEIEEKDVKEDDVNKIDVEKLEAPAPEPGDEELITPEKDAKKSKKKKKSQVVEEEATPVIEGDKKEEIAPSEEINKGKKKKKDKKTEEKQEEGGF
jgi:predicted DNA-binding protein